MTPSELARSIHSPVYGSRVLSSVCLVGGGCVRSEGYSLWYCEYQFNNELSKLFMTCNLVSGFVQRTDEVSSRLEIGCHVPCQRGSHFFSQEDHISFTDESLGSRLQLLDECGVPACLLVP